MGRCTVVPHHMRPDNTHSYFEDSAATPPTGEPPTLAIGPFEF